MKNNVYDTHNIGHLSASFLNTWVSSPWQAIAKLAGLEGSVGPAAYRGIAAEEGLEFAVRKNNLAEGIAKANMKFNELNGSSQFGEKVQSIERFVSVWRERTEGIAQLC